MEQFLKFKKEKLQDKPTTSPIRYAASASFSKTSTKTEKMHGRLDFELEQVRKNREKKN